VDVFGLIVILYALYRIRFLLNIRKTTTVVIITIFSALVAIVIFLKGDYFTLMWTIFIPIITILLKGTKKGLRFSIVFYAIIFFLTYQGVDIWQNGTWSIASYSRYVLISIIFTTIIYVYQLGLEKMYITLEEKRKQEKSYIEQLTQYSITDPLTKLYNRRYLDQIFSKNFKLVSRNNHLYALVMMDLDYFKKYNDKHGHIAGDDVLVKISKILSNNMRRDNDYAFRVGGEEFACLIMGQNEENIIKHIDRIRQEIEETKLITASFGVCIIDKFDYEDFDEMYKIADDFLYKAKEKGRNQVLGGLTRLKQNI
jgi:diguanylate cyclase (GGDEF)-like protein